MTPEWGSSAEDVPPETQFLLTEVEEGGPYAIILPLISQSTFRGTLRPPNKEQKGNSADHLFLRLESHNEDVTASHFKDTVLVQASWDLYDLVDEAVALAASLSGGSRPLREKQLPESLNVFGWCTWDAFYSKVSAKGIREGLTSLNNGGVPPRLLVIDDGWQQTDVDLEQRKMFGDEHMSAEEIWEAERMALSMEAKELEKSGGGTSAYAATVRTTIEDEDELLERQRMRDEYLRESLLHLLESAQSWRKDPAPSLRRPLESALMTPSPLGVQCSRCR